jgi:hypothetical protein
MEGEPERLRKLAQHLAVRAPQARPEASGVQWRADGCAACSAVRLEVGKPAVVGPGQLIMGSAGNWQTEDGIVMNEEERAVATLLAAMQSGITDFDTAPLCAAA